MRFNPTLVRLRPLRYSSIRSTKPDAFQSHAGSIEAFFGSPVLGLSPWFQSHAGSIEASMAPSVFGVR